MAWADVLQAKTAKEVNHTVELGARGTEASFYSLLDTLRKRECRFGDTVRVATSQLPLELNVTIHGETKAHLRRSMVWTRFTGLFPRWIRQQHQHSQLQQKAR